MAKKVRIIEGLEIQNITTEGRGIGRLPDGLVCFVEKAVPGDIVNVKVVKKKKDFLEGIAIAFEKKSELRQTPFCNYFGICGGCKWQYLSYEQQLLYKAELAQSNLQRIGKVADAEFLPIIGADSDTYYRNKMEFSFSSERWLMQDEIDTKDHLEYREGLGLHVQGNFVKVVDIKKCFLQPDPSNDIRNCVREWALANQVGFYNRISHTGWLRNLIIRNNRIGEVMVVLIVKHDDQDKINSVLELLKTKIPAIVSLGYVINPKVNDTIYDQEVVNYYGPDHLIERIGDLTYKISPKSFFQTNTLQAEKLYNLALEFAELSGHEVVYDLYTGTGSIALYAARHCKKVIGVETVSDAIADAHINAEMNGISNASFFCGEVEKLFTPSFVEQHGNPDLIITDPPRAGMHPDVVKTILGLDAPKIVYISCNPSTQARDLALLQEEYRVVKSRPVDLFPHTYHIENVVLLVKK